MIWLRDKLPPEVAPLAANISITINLTLLIYQVQGVVEKYSESTECLNLVLLWEEKKIFESKAFFRNKKVDYENYIISLMS